MKNLFILLFSFFALSVTAQTANYTHTISRTDAKRFEENESHIYDIGIDTLTGSNDTLLIQFDRTFPAFYGITYTGVLAASSTSTTLKAELLGRNKSSETWVIIDDVNVTTEGSTTTLTADLNYMYLALRYVSSADIAHVNSTILLKKKSSSAAAVGGAAYIEVTYAAAATLITAGGLVPGTTYKINDRGDRGIFLTAISENQLSNTGKRLMLCPKTYATTSLDGNTWLGIWTSTLTPSAGDYCIWGAMVWRNTSGSVGSNSSDLALGVDWVLVSKDTFNDNEYIEKVFSVEYDLANDWIGIQRDNRGNQFGAPYISGGNNYSDLSDWNFVTNDDAFSNNECRFFLNNRIDRAHGNKLVGAIYYGIKNNTTTSITENTCEGSIEGNIVDGSIYNNSNIDDIIDNEVTGDIAYNSCGGAIEENIGVNDIINNSNTLGIASNEHDGDIKNNRNNGSIQNCTGSGGFSVQYNTNNGNINNPAGLGAGNITDSIVNK